MNTCRTSQNSVPANFGESRLGEVRILGILRSSHSENSWKFAKKVVENTAIE
jgi:hypothetical protein